MLARLLQRLAQAEIRYRNPLGLLAQRALGRKVVTVTDRATGLRFRCRRGADRMLGEIFHSRIYDIPTAPVRAGDVVIDVGANHGFASCCFAQRGAQVFAFEPDPETYPFLVANIAANGLAARVRTFPTAVAGHEGVAALRTSARLGGGMSTLSPEFASANRLELTSIVEVRTETVPQILARLGIERVRLLKLDCEGSELEILRSLRDLAPEALAWIDSIAVEYHPQAYPLPDLLAALLSLPGFHLSKVVTQEVSNANLNAVSDRAFREWALAEPKT
jgi:FkbM family methyltransferase